MELQAKNITCHPTYCELFIVAWCNLTSVMQYWHGVFMQPSGGITKKTNPYDITKQIQCTRRITFKTIKATEIVRST